MDGITQVAIFYSEIMRLIDQGETISIDELEVQYDKNNIVDYIGKEFGFKNANSIPENQNELKEKIQTQYISKQSAENQCITNNGLVYLATILFEIVRKEYFDNRWN